MISSRLDLECLCISVVRTVNYRREDIVGKAREDREGLELIPGSSIMFIGVTLHRIIKVVRSNTQPHFWIIRYDKAEG
jgi:hypothetical protein